MAANRAKKEVEQNPFKTLIDISDLIEFESNPKEVEKEVQNTLLRNNSDLKSWYKHYSRKVEAQKSEESFSMTLRQVWRFLRDCQVIGPDATLAQFDRVYFQGRKNHYTLLGAKDKHKFHFSQPNQKDLIKDPNAEEAKVDKKMLNIDDSIIKRPDGDDESDQDEEEEEDAESFKNMFNVEAEDLHMSQK